MQTMKLRMCTRIKMLQIFGSPFWLLFLSSKYSRPRYANQMRPVAFLFGNNPSVFLDLQPASPVRPVFFFFFLFFLEGGGSFFHLPVFFLSFVVGKKKKQKHIFIMKNVFVRFILLHLRVSYFFASMSNYAIHLGPVCLLYLLLRRVWPACAPFFFILHVYYTHITDILSLT